MPRITFKPRLGKDFFEFTERALVNQDLATEWALTNFVLIDGKPLEVEDIYKISDRYFVQLSNTVFSVQTPENVIIESDGSIIYQESNRLLTVKAKQIKRNTLTRMQTNISKKNIKKTDVLKESLTSFFEVNSEEIMRLPYQLVAVMSNQANDFLRQLSEPKDEFEFTDDFWSETPKEDVSQ